MAIKSVKQALKFVKLQGGEYLQFVPSQFRSQEVCLEAVKENGLALLFVEHQTHRICLEAVKNQGWALRYV